MKVNHFFFYGNFMANCIGHEKFLKAHVTSVKQGWIKGCLYHDPMNGPVLVDGEHFVAGEVMSFCNIDRIAAYLDALKGCRNEYGQELYERNICSVKLLSGEVVLAYVYKACKGKSWEVQNLGVQVFEGNWSSFIDNTNIFSGCPEKQFSHRQDA